MQTEQHASGVLQINEKGFGFLRHAESNYLPSPRDVFVPRNLIQHFRLREGVQLIGTSSPSDDGRGGRGGRGRVQSDQLATIELINGTDPDQYSRMPEFTKLTSVDPTERLELSAGNPNMSMRVLDLIAPIGKGQRGLIVAPPKTGKTTLIEEIAEAVADNHPETYLVVLLVDERPEEVTHLKRRVRCEVIFQEFKGTGNLEIQLDRRLAERRIWPAIDISKSGTRKEEKLFDADTMPQINLLRRALANKKPIEAMEMLLKGLGESRDNLAFLDKLKQNA